MDRTISIAERQMYERCRDTKGDCICLEGTGHCSDDYDEFLTAYNRPHSSTLGESASAWLRAVADMLEQKAVQYGDSAGQPVRMFSSADMIEQLKVRADDKLSRLTRGTSGGEDAVKDLVGYIALLAAAGWTGNGK